MFNVGSGELLVILLLALIVLGPDKLPQAARTVARTLGELRRLSQSVQSEIRQAVDLGSLDQLTRPGTEVGDNPDRSDGPARPPSPQEHRDPPDHRDP